MPSMKRSSPPLRHGVAVLGVGMAFLVVFGAIMVSAWYGDLGPGLLATFAAGLVTDYFFLHPTGTFSGFSLEVVPLLAFVLEGTHVCLLTGVLRAAKWRAEASKLEAGRHHEDLRRSEDHSRSLVEGVRDYAIFMLDPQRVASKATGVRRSSGTARGGRFASWSGMRLPTR